jgi:hypothetical protein
VVNKQILLYILYVHFHNVWLKYVGVVNKQVLLYILYVHFNNVWLKYVGVVNKQVLLYILYVHFDNVWLKLLSMCIIPLSWDNKIHRNIKQLKCYLEVIRIVSCA